MVKVKDSMKKLLVGILALAFCLGMVAPMALAQTGNTSDGGLDVKSNLCAGTSIEWQDDPNCEGVEGATEDVNNLVKTIINVFSWIIGAVAVIMIIYAGFRYIVSGGSSAGVTAAKNTIIYALIGLIVVALAQVIVRFVLDRVTESDSTTTGG